MLRRYCSSIGRISPKVSSPLCVRALHKKRCSFPWFSKASTLFSRHASSGRRSQFELPGKTSAQSAAEAFKVLDHMQESIPLVYIPGSETNTLSAENICELYIRLAQHEDSDIRDALQHLLNQMHEGSSGLTTELVQVIYENYWRFLPRENLLVIAKERSYAHVDSLTDILELPHLGFLDLRKIFGPKLSSAFIDVISGNLEYVESHDIYSILSELRHILKSGISSGVELDDTRRFRADVYLFLKNASSHSDEDIAHIAKKLHRQITSRQS